MCAFGWVWVAAFHVRGHVRVVLHMQDAEQVHSGWAVGLRVGVSQASPHLISVKSVPRQHSKFFSVDHEGDWKCLYK